MKIGDVVWFATNKPTGDMVYPVPFQTELIANAWIKHSAATKEQANNWYSIPVRLVPVPPQKEPSDGN